MYSQALLSAPVPALSYSERRQEIRRKQAEWNFIRLSTGRRRLDRNLIKGGGLNFSIFPAMRGCC